MGGKEESGPKKAKTVLSSGKIMTTVFWDSQGISLVDYLEKGATIAGAYYSSLLDCLKTELLKKRLARKKVLFYYDNAPDHPSAVVFKKSRDIGFQLISHPLPPILQTWHPRTTICSPILSNGWWKILFKRGVD